MPWRRRRAANSSVNAADALPPLFICASVSSVPDSAPEKIIVEPRARHRRPRRIRYLHQHVDAAERPPAQAEIRDPLAEFRGARLADEEVHVVHLHGVDLVGRHEMPHDALHARRRLRQPAPVRHRDDRAEAAGERTAERGVVRHRPPSEVVRVDVPLHRDTVVRQVGQLVEVVSGWTGLLTISPPRLTHPTCLPHLPHRPSRFPGEAADAVEDAAGAQDVDQLQQRAFALRADHEVDIRRAQDRVRVLGRKVAAPDDGHVRQRCAHARADSDRLRQLRARHHGDREQRRLRSRDAGQVRDDLRRRIGERCSHPPMPHRYLRHRYLPASRLSPAPPPATSATTAAAACPASSRAG